MGRKRKPSFVSYPLSVAANSNRSVSTLNPGTRQSLGSATSLGEMSAQTHGHLHTQALQAGTLELRPLLQDLVEQP